MSEIGRGKAAGLGAAGCFGTFVAIGFIVLLLGGAVYLDGGGLILLLLIGSVLGLVVRAIYNAGRNDAFRATEPTPRGPPSERSTDELMMEAEQLFNEGLIDRVEYDRRIRRAWGHE